VTGRHAPAELLAETAIGVAGLHRPHPEANLTAVADAICDAFRGEGLGGGPIRLGRARRLVVLAVDGLGYDLAADALSPDWVTALTSEFPSTTVSCMLSAVTGRPTSEHGLIGVHQLDDDGLGAVNCFDGARDEPTSAWPARPTATPDTPTIFDRLARSGLRSAALPQELGHLHKRVTGRMFGGCVRVAGAPPAPVDIRRVVAEARRRIDEAWDAPPPVDVIWCYVDLDTHAHRHGPDAARANAVAELDRLARGLSARGAAVALFSDHGLVPNRARRATVAALAEAGTRCRLPAGGAGRVRWLYPHAAAHDALCARLADRLPDAVVTTPEQLAAWGLVGAGSIGQRRLGEIVLLARGPDFPAPNPTARFEHGSMTPDEILVPFAVWHPADA
jgi:hypothetical protein